MQMSIQTSWELDMGNVQKKEKDSRNTRTSIGVGQGKRVERKQGYEPTLDKATASAIPYPLELRLN